MANIYGCRLAFVQVIVDAPAFSFGSNFVLDCEARRARCDFG
jgi:hypothetical protein